MRIAIAQMNSTTGALVATIDRMLEYASAAADAGVGLLVFPAPVLTGPAPGGLTESEEFLTDLMAELVRFSQNVRLACLVPLTLETPEGTLHEAVLVREGQLMPLAMAARLAAMGQGTLDAFTAPGFAWDGVRFGVAFGTHDLDNFSHEDLADQIDVLLYLPVDSYNTDDEFTALAPAVSQGAYLEDAAAIDAWLVVAGAMGGYDEQVFCGGSFVMAPWGELAAVAPSFEEALLVADIDPSSEGPLASPVTAPPYVRTRFLWDALALCLRDYVTKLGMEGVVVPLTGQLTSAVLAALAVDALGPTKVHGVVLPVHASLGTAELCRQLALNLRIGFEDPLSSVMGEAARALASHMEAWGDDSSITRRLHIDLSNVMIAHRARELKGIALGISDKTSMACEWTLAVCSASAIEPVGDVYRSDVLALALERNKQSPVIPDGIIDNYDLPAGLGLEELGTSDELRLSQLDAILYLHVERGMGISRIADEGFDEALVERVLHRVDECGVWRRRVGLVPFVSQRSLASRAWPSACGWHDHPRDDDEGALEEALRTGMERALGDLLGADAVDDGTMDDLLGLFGGDDGLPSDLGELEALWGAEE